MHEATTTPTLTSDTPEDLTAAARKAEAWFGEPFLQPDEEATIALAPGTARRAALAEALAEMAAGDQAMHVRIAAVEAIGATSAGDAADLLVGYAGEPQTEIAAAALRSLGRLRDARAINTSRHSG